ncbi:MAG: T9SS type A sorting domain-containing protein [Bacteroidales bacterium]|nr:T9SS type A sorting domain-containing protein [Bacteroidales bacterium]
MRKILLSILLILPSYLLYSQYTGSGTLSDPYIGTINISETWDNSYADNTIYVCRPGEPLTVTSGNQLTVGTGLTLSINGDFIIEPGAAVSAGTIINNETLKLESDETGIASLIFDDYSGTGETQTELYLTGGYTTVGETNYYKWHYISTPTSTPIPVDIFTVKTNNLAQYVESEITTDPDVGWFAYDGYNYSGGAPNYSFSDLVLGKSYDYFHLLDETYTITGSLNYNDVPINLTYGGTYPYTQGFNLIGNPFSSFFDWDYLWINELIPEDVDDAIYFTHDGQMASYVTGVAQGGASNCIPPMQGFFVKANQNNIDLPLPALGRVHDNQPRLKSKNTESSNSRAIPLVRLKIMNDNYNDDAVVRFDVNALPVFDKSFDAYKLNKTGSVISIWTNTGDVDYSINGIPFPEETVEIPVGIFTAADGTYRIFSNEIKFLDTYSVFIKDISTNEVLDLKTGGELTFYSSGGITEDRFRVIITKTLTSLPKTDVRDRLFTIYSKDGIINIVPLSENYETPGMITIYDLAGKKVLQQSNIDWNGNDLIQFRLNSSTEGLYIVEIKAGHTKFVHKVYFYY